VRHGETLSAVYASNHGGVLALPTRDLRRQRMYVEPHLHPFLSSLSYSSSGSSSSSFYPGQHSSITFHCRLNKPRLAYLMDHIVLGRPLLPAAAMMELAAAIAASLTADSAAEDGSLLAVQGLTMSAPIIMPDPAAAGSEDDLGLVVVCSLDLATGQLKIGYMQETGEGLEAMQMTVCATATAGIVRAAGAAGSAAQQQQEQQERLQAGALAVLSGILAPHTAAAVLASGSAAAVPAAAASTRQVIGAIEGVSEEWHASGYFSNPRQVDSALHLGVVQPGSGAKVPVAVGCFLVPAVAARGAATGRLLASSAADSVSPAQAASGVSSASYIISSDDDYSSAGSGVRAGRVPGRSTGMAAGAGELVLVIDGLQTKVPRQADLARQQRAARSVSQQQQQQEGVGAAAGAGEAGEEDYPCSYEVDWQLSEPANGKMAAAAAAAAAAVEDVTLRSAGKLTVLMHGEADTEEAAAASTPQAVQLQLNAGNSPAAAAATTLALLQQVNQMQAAAAAAPTAFALQAELPSSSSKLGPGEGLQSSTAAAADATSAVWGLLRTEATEQTGITVSLIDSDSMQPATADAQRQQQQVVSVQGAASGSLEAAAVRGAAVHVPRLLPVLRPEAAEHLVIQPEPHSSLSNLVARAADISQVG
jgi:hypothetical protein